MCRRIHRQAPAADPGALHQECPLGHPDRPAVCGGRTCPTQHCEFPALQGLVACFMCRVRASVHVVCNRYFHNVYVQLYQALMSTLLLDVLLFSFCSLSLILTILLSFVLLCFSFFCLLTFICFSLFRHLYFLF